MPKWSRVMYNGDAALGEIAKTIAIKSNTTA